MIAVIERHTNLTAARTPSRLELTYLQSADDLAQMVAEGTFPFPGADRHAGPVAAGRRRAAPAGRGRAGSSTPARTRCRPTAGSAWPPTWSAPTSARSRPRLVAVGRAGGRGADRWWPAAGRPREAEVEANGTVVQLRVDPADRRRQPDRRAGAGARRHRGAPPRARADQQGRDHPGDPPPGEEQPADGGRAAAAAGPAAAGRPRRGRRWRRRCAGSARSRWCTRRCRTRSRRSSTSTRSPTGWPAMAGEVAAAEVRVIPQIDRGRSACCPRRWRPRWPWC